MTNRPTTILETLMTRNQLAKWVGCSPRTIDNWVRAGSLPEPIRFGGLVRWHPGKVADHLGIPVPAGEGDV